MTGRMAVQVLLTWRCAKSGKTGQNTMAQVQVGQNLWRAPWAALDQPCSQEDGLVYIRVNSSLRDMPVHTTYIQSTCELRALHTPGTCLVADISLCWCQGSAKPQ